MISRRIFERIHFYFNLILSPHLATPAIQAAREVWIARCEWQIGWSNFCSHPDLALLARHGVSFQDNHTRPCQARLTLLYRTLPHVIF